MWLYVSVGVTYSYSLFDRVDFVRKDLLTDLNESVFDELSSAVKNSKQTNG